MLVIHVGEAGVGSSSLKLLSMIADELELAIGGGAKCPCLVPAQALRKALAWYAHTGAVPKFWTH